MLHERNGIEITSEKDLNKIKNEAERRVAKKHLVDGYAVRSQVYAGNHPIDLEVTAPNGETTLVEVTVSEKVRALGSDRKKRQLEAAQKTDKKVLLITREDLPDYD